MCSLESPTGLKRVIETANTTRAAGGAAFWSSDGGTVRQGRNGSTASNATLGEHWHASLQLEAKFRSLIANLLAEANAGAA